MKSAGCSYSLLLTKIVIKIQHIIEIEQFRRVYITIYC
jgi:hypothetical protein